MLPLIAVLALSTAPPPTIDVLATPVDEIRGIPCGVFADYQILRFHVRTSSDAAIVPGSTIAVAVVCPVDRFGSGDPGLRLLTLAPRPTSSHPSPGEFRWSFAPRIAPVYYLR